MWNLTGNEVDDAYVRAIEGERIVIHNELHTGGGPSAFKRVYRHYGQDEFRDCLFVKLDDDIVFLETARFGAFLAAVDAYRGFIVSANVVNNGACAPLEPGLWDAFESLGVRLLDVHKQNAYAELAHGWFFEHYADRVGQDIELVPTEDWLSINCIGYDWRMAREFALQLGRVPHPTHISGRNFPAPWGIMDEGLGNMFPRLIVRGFTACHLTFGPQGCTGEQCERWRGLYAEIGERYLGSARPDSGWVLPGLSAVSFRQGPPEVPAHLLGNDPAVGRFTP